MKMTSEVEENAEDISTSVFSFSIGHRQLRLRQNE